MSVSWIREKGSQHVIGQEISKDNIIMIQEYGNTESKNNTMSFVWH